MSASKLCASVKEICELKSWKTRMYSSMEFVGAFEVYAKEFHWLSLQRPQCVYGLLTIEAFKLDYKR